MREHAHLPAMVGFMRKHVAQHLGANRPRPSPAVSEKLLDATAGTAERFGEHLLTASGALGQTRTCLLRRAVRAVELEWNLEVRRRKPDPLGADIVHVREDGRNGARVAVQFDRQLRIPGGRVKMFNESLVHEIVSGKEANCGLGELSVGLLFRGGHGSLLLIYGISSGRRPDGINRTLGVAIISKIQSAPPCGLITILILSPRLCPEPFSAPCSGRKCGSCTAARRKRLVLLSIWVHAIAVQARHFDKISPCSGAPAAGYPVTGWSRRADHARREPGRVGTGDSRLLPCLRQLRETRQFPG